MCPFFLTALSRDYKRGTRIPIKGCSLVGIAVGYDDAY